MALIYCTECGQEYPSIEIPFCCPACGGVFDFKFFPDYDLSLIEKELPGIWRYRHTFGLPIDAPLVTLGEGNTPLLWDTYRGKKIGLKMESNNPTGSYKDRGTAVLVSQLKSRRVDAAVEDSSGNAGASFAAYAARSAIKARIFVPESASGPKRRQIEMYGADLVPVPGPRSNAADAVKLEAEKGWVYASHALLPFGLPGIATIAYELVEQLGQAPGTVVVPVGHASLLLGIVRGFQALLYKGLIESMPYFVGVQAAACAPVYQSFISRSSDDLTADEGETLAEGVRVLKPVRKTALLTVMKNGVGEIMAVDEKGIRESFYEMGRRGIYAEPTSALTWSVLDKIIGNVPDPIILVVSGSGLKY